MIAQADLAYVTRASTAAAWFDGDGFLVEPGNWTPSLAEHLAQLEDIGDLTAKHWEVIHFVRQRFFAMGALPVMRLVCRAVGLDRSQAHELFSSCKSLWRLAGLPNPGEEAMAYMN